MQKFSLVYTTVFTATISGYSSWYEIEDYAEEYKIEQVHKAFLEKSFEVTTGKYICLDGKTMRGVKKLDFDADSHCVAAFDPKQQASLAQVYISTKSNEINAIREILKALDLRDSVITIDAIGTQTEIAKAVTQWLSASKSSFLTPLIVLPPRQMCLPVVISKLSSRKAL